MSGIAVVHGRRPDSVKLDRMVKALRHRAPVSTGLFAHRPGGPLRIAFSGRLFNRAELRDRLGKDRFGLETSDADLALALYEQMGEEFPALLDGVFALVVDDPAKSLYAARDPLGCQPLYLADADGDLVFCSEMKAFPASATRRQVFRPGCWYRPVDGFQKFAGTTGGIERRPAGPDLPDRIVEVLQTAVDRRMAGCSQVGVLLSGGLDSSIITSLAAHRTPVLDTFTVGVAGSGDILYARQCAEHLGTRHHEEVYDLSDMLEVLPEVIRSLESFDAALVRSAIPNYLAARLAHGRVDDLLSGEGADELFAGYSYMLKMTPVQREREIGFLLASLHDTGLQRGDRMAAAFGLTVLAPFLDRDFLRLALSLPIAELTSPQGEEKWPLRKAFVDWLPPGILERRKQKFSVGSGSSRLIAHYADETISDSSFARESLTAGGHVLVNKEELLYYRIFRKFHPDEAEERAIGFTRNFS